MIHTEEYDQCEYIYKVNPNGFWKEVKDKELPFHRWYRWLEDKFNKLRDGDEDKPGNAEEEDDEFRYGDFNITRGASQSLRLKVEESPIVIVDPTKLTPKRAGIFSRFFGGGKSDKKDNPKF